MTGLVMLGLAVFFLVLILFIHRYFGQAITSPSADRAAAGAAVSAFTGEIGPGGDIGGDSGGGSDACGGHGGDCGDGGSGGH